MSDVEGTPPPAGRTYRSLPAEPPVDPRTAPRTAPPTAEEGDAASPGRLPAARAQLHPGHTAPHAASAGPQEGARGALWFAGAAAAVVVVSLLGLLVLAALG